MELVSHVLKTTTTKVCLLCVAFALRRGQREILMRELIDIAELARRLKVAVSFVYDRTRKNSPDPIPHLKVGKYLRFDPTAVDKWLAERNR